LTRAAKPNARQLASTASRKPGLASAFLE